MSFADLIAPAAKPAAASSPHSQSPMPWPVRSWGSAGVPRKTTEPPAPLPFDPVFAEPAPGAAPQEEESKINKKGILADVANIGKQIHEDFTEYQNLLKVQGPQLISLKWRAEVFLNLLKVLKKAGQLRTPAIREEYKDIVKKYESLHFKRMGHLASYVKNYLTEWVSPVAATALSSAASRVHFISAIQGKLKDRADTYYADYLGFRQSLGAFQADLDRVWILIDEIDGVIASFTSKELPCGLKRFVEGVEADQEKLVPNLHTQERNELIVTMRNLIQPSARVEEHIGRMCGWGARLNQWLEHPEMAAAQGPKDGIIREGTVESLRRIAEVYQNEKLADLGANIQDLGRPLEQTLGQLRIISRGLGLAEKLSPEIKSWAQAAADGAVNYLEGAFTRFKEANRTFYDLKTKAESRFAVISRSIDARKEESPVPQAKVSLREAMEQAMLRQSAKRGFWWSLVSGWSWRSRPAAAEEQLDGLSVLEGRLANLDWVKARQIAIHCSFDPIFADEATTRALLPPERLRRDLQNVIPSDMKLEDFWLKAVRFWPQARGLIQQAQGYNNRGAHLKATYQLLKRFVEQLRTKHVPPELEKLRPLVALSLAQLRQDCKKHREARHAIATSDLIELEGKLKAGLDGSLPAWDQAGDIEARHAAVRQVIQQLELLKALLTSQNTMAEQTDEIEQWLSQNEKWVAASGQFFYAGDPFIAKVAEATSVPSARVAAAVSVALPEERNEKPAGLGKQLQDRQWSQRPDQFLDQIETKLPELIQLAKQWESEKLSYHESAFKRICGSIHRMEYQIEQLFANVLHLEQAASALTALYGSKPLEDKRTPLVKQLELLKAFQGQLAVDAAACRNMLPQSIELLEKMAREEVLKMTVEKINWRKQQENYLTRTPEGNQRRLEQLQRSALMYRFAALRLQMLWDVAKEAYKKAEERVEALNYLQNAIPGKLYGYYLPALLNANPLTEVVEVKAVQEQKE